MEDNWFRRQRKIEQARRLEGRSGWTSDVEPILAAPQQKHERAGPYGPRRRSLFPSIVALAVIASFGAPFAAQRFDLFDNAKPAIAVAPPIRTSPIVVQITSRKPAARAIPICSGGDRAKRRLTCIVDGDTGWHDGVKWRLTSHSSGVDAPEISKPKCSAERQAGDRATKRLQALMSGGYTIAGEGSDGHDRKLVVIELADGRDAGEVLIREGLAQEWPNSRNPWCS